MLPTDPLTLCTIFTLENANECRLINDQLLEFYYTAHSVPKHGIFIKNFVCIMTFAVYWYQSKSRTSLIGLLTVFGSIKWMKHSEFEIWNDTVKSRFFKNCELYWSNLPQNLNLGQESFVQKSGEGQIFCHFSFFLYLFHFVHKKLNIKT